MIDEAKEVNTTLIPYSEITNIIFSHYHYNGNESSFTEQWKSVFEKHIIKKFGIQDVNKTDVVSTTDDLFNKPSISEQAGLNIDKNHQNALLVIYKIIQHAELAISQKQNLYQSLRDEMDALDNNVDEATKKYDNMMSNFISILGIFAAIMMATFGAIQGFSAIFSNENNYNLTTIIIISCFGLFGLISILFILLHSIAKLIDKELVNHYYGRTIFSRYPIYSHTLLLLFIISIAALTHFFKLNPPPYMPEFLVQNLWSLSILIGLIMITVYFLHYLISQSDGYGHLNRHINKYIMNLKDKTGLKNLLNIIIVIFVISIILIVAFLLLNIFKPLF